MKRDVQALTERVEGGMLEEIIQGNLEWNEDRWQKEGAIQSIRREFKRDKLRKLLIQHRLRLCTITKKEYVSFCKDITFKS